MSIEIRELDRHDEAQVRAFWEIGRDAVADRPYNTFLAWQAAKTYIPMDFPDRDRHFEAAWDGDRMVAAWAVSGGTIDNLHLAWADVDVLPDHRRRGIGTPAARPGRGVGPDQGPPRPDRRGVRAGRRHQPALEFATRHGFKVTIEDEMKVVDLPATRDRWAALAAECGAAPRGLRAAHGPGADPRRAGRRLLRHQTCSSPRRPPATPTSRTRCGTRLGSAPNQERAAKAGRRDVTTFALSRDGEVAAMTEPFVNETLPHRGFQGGTLVVPAHRGHRLGLAVKVANQQALDERFPELAWIVTGNADVNAHMNAINDRLGFRVVERCLEVEKAL